MKTRYILNIFFSFIMLSAYVIYGYLIWITPKMFKIPVITP